MLMPFVGIKIHFTITLTNYNRKSVKVVLAVLINKIRLNSITL